MNRIAIALPLLVVTLAAGCLDPGALPPDGPLKIAFTAKDDFDAFVANTQPLADWIARETGRPTSILPVADESAAIAALATADAHAAFLDGGAAWVGWQKFGLQAIAADQNGDGRTYYWATAWVMNESDIRAPADLAGRVSCHTGELKSAGMLAPMGYLIREGHIDASGVPDDVSSIRLLRERFFKDPVVGGDYVGAFQCLSEGRGEVAFVKDTTWSDYCGVEAPPAWCLPEGDYRELFRSAQVPSHPVMVPATLDDATRDAIQTALLALNGSDEGRNILSGILKTPGITAVTAEEHLGSYGGMVAVLPGIDDHFAPSA